MLETALYRWRLTVLSISHVVLEVVVISALMCQCFSKRHAIQELQICELRGIFSIVI